ncbi:MAG: hypothetical protein ACXVJD_01630 [Mucilaginibacter sp.]
MGIFDIFKKKSQPYNNQSIDLIYELLFCDDISLYKEHGTQTDTYPWDILFSDAATVVGLEAILADVDIGSRVKILTYNKLHAMGQAIDKKILLGVIVEIGLDKGLDVLASFNDGTARYINQTGKIIIWETPDKISDNMIKALFDKSYSIIEKIGPWDQPRQPRPEKDIARITFLVSDGLYFGEGPINVLFNDQMAGPALSSAAEIMKYLITKTS